MYQMLRNLSWNWQRLSRFGAGVVFVLSATISALTYASVFVMVLYLVVR